jgi:hypothetical protein
LTTSGDWFGEYEELRPRFKFKLSISYPMRESKHDLNKFISVSQVNSSVPGAFRTLYHFVNNCILVSLGSIFLRALKHSDTIDDEEIGGKENRYKVESIL